MAIHKKTPHLRGARTCSLTDWFGAFAQPIAYANGPDASRDREGAVAPKRTTPCGHGTSDALYYYDLFPAQAATILPRPKSEGRKRIAQCASTGNRAQDRLAPERGVRIRTSFALRASRSTRRLRLAAMWGSQSWLPPAFSRRFRSLPATPPSEAPDGRL
jgi:hypothetical protein